MTYPDQPAQPYAQPLPAKKKPNRVLVAVLWSVLAVLALCVGGTAIIAATTDRPKDTANTATDTTPNGQQPAAVAPTSTAPAAPPPPPPPPPSPTNPTIEDGTWTVGLDIPPGSYRTTTNVGSSCYWAIYKSGTNGADIIDNDIPGGGRPQVTLKAGQDFRTSRCGKWSKVG